MDECTLKAILEKHWLLRNVKVVAKNELHVMPSWFIVNNKTRGHRGEHWMVICTKTKPYEYFDPLGQPPAYYGFVNTEFCYIPKTAQNYRSNVCWLYCLYYILKRRSGVSMQCVVDNLNYDCIDVVVNYLCGNKVI